MSPAPTRLYRVRIFQWDTLECTLRARNADAAEHKAEELWERRGDSAFEHVAGGVDYVEAEEVAS